MPLLPAGYLASRVLIAGPSACQIVPEGAAFPILPIVSVTGEADLPLSQCVKIDRKQLLLASFPEPRFVPALFA